MGLTYASDAKEKTSMAEIILGRLELLGSFKVGQLFSNRTSIRQRITRKIL